MVKKGRRFHCHHCGAETWICKRCDRGQCYCSLACRHKARREINAQARKRYEATSAGRCGNARRQREWYERKRNGEKVAENLTHPGSPGPAVEAIIPPSTVDTGVAVVESTKSVDTKAAETPVNERAADLGDLPSGVHLCVICRCFLESQSPTETQNHGTEETTSQS